MDRAEPPWPVTLHSILPHLRKVIPGNGASLLNTSVLSGTSQHDQFSVFNGYSGELQSSGSASELEFIHANRDKLLASLEVGLNIHWGKVYYWHTILDEVVYLYFRDGSTTQGSVLVGCDGVESKGIHPFYTFRAYLPNLPSIKI